MYPNAWNCLAPAWQSWHLTSCPPPRAGQTETDWTCRTQIKTPQCWHRVVASDEQT